MAVSTLLALVSYLEPQLLHLPHHPRFLPGLLNLKDIIKGHGPWLLILDGLHNVHPEIHLYPVHHPTDGCFIFIGKLVISLLKVLAKMSFLASCRVSSLVSCCEMRIRPELFPSKDSIYRAYGSC